MIQTGTMIDHIYIHVGHGDKTAILAVEATCAEIDVENRNDAEYVDHIFHIYGAIDLRYVYLMLKIETMQNI